LSGGALFLLLAKLSKLFVNRPVSEGENEWHNYAGYRYEHKQAQRPMVAGFGEYLAIDDRLDNEYHCRYYQSKQQDRYYDDRAKGIKHLFRIGVRAIHFVFLSVNWLFQVFNTGNNIAGIGF